MVLIKVIVNSNDICVKKVMEIKFEICDSCNYLEIDEILN